MSFRKFVDWFKVGHRLGVTIFLVFFGIAVVIDPSLHTIHSLYSAMWSNIWAPSMWTLFGIFLADFRNARLHRETRAHHLGVVSELAGRVDTMADRLKSAIGGEDDPEDKPRQNRSDSDPRTSRTGDTGRPMA